MRNYLQSGTIGDVFYKTVFDWTDANLHDAIRRANEALGRAGIKPTETLSRIRLGKGTGQLSEGARKRLCAEAESLLGVSTLTVCSSCRTTGMTQANLAGSMRS